MEKSFEELNSLGLDYIQINLISSIYKQINLTTISKEKEYIERHLYEYFHYNRGKDYLTDNLRLINKLYKEYKYIKPEQFAYLITLLSRLEDLTFLLDKDLTDSKKEFLASLIDSYPNLSNEKEYFDLLINIDNTDMAIKILDDRDEHIKTTNYFLPNFKKETFFLARSIFWELGRKDPLSEDMFEVLNALQDNGFKKEMKYINPKQLNYVVLHKKAQLINFINKEKENIPCFISMLYNNKETEPMAYELIDKCNTLALYDYILDECMKKDTTEINNIINAVNKFLKSNNDVISTSLFKDIMHSSSDVDTLEFLFKNVHDNFELNSLKKIINYLDKNIDLIKDVKFSRMHFTFYEKCMYHGKKDLLIACFANRKIEQKIITELDIQGASTSDFPFEKLLFDKRNNIFKKYEDEYAMPTEKVTALIDGYRCGIPFEKLEPLIDVDINVKNMRLLISAMDENKDFNINEFISDAYKCDDMTLHKKIREKITEINKKGPTYDRT